jgi:hypothetical protein
LVVVCHTYPLLIRLLLQLLPAAAHYLLHNLPHNLHSLPLHLLHNLNGKTYMISSTTSSNTLALVTAAKAWGI